MPALWGGLALLALAGGAQEGGSRTAAANTAHGGTAHGGTAQGGTARRSTAQRGTELVGTMHLLERGGRRAARGEALDEAVVWFEPGGGEPEVRPARALLETVGKSFVPRVLVVPVGSTVRFPNRDPILHNAFSVSRGNRFDLGLVKQGPGDEVTFERGGVVRVFCNVHHDMVAYILVLDTPWFARPDDRGRFVFRGLPAGSGTLHAWHERAEPVQVPVTVPSTGTGSRVDVRLEISRPRVPPHLNKFGRRYGRSRDRYP